MNILMMTNTYLPHVGGVANSVSASTAELKKRGHRVIVVAPEYEQAADDEADVIRLPAIQHFNGSDFSVIVPIHGFLHHRLDKFKPDIVHSHHPFLVGSTAVRVAKKYDLPLVYTQHTMFEQYTHYVPVGYEKLKQFVVRLSTGYANMTDTVIAPSGSIADILRRRGVNRPIEVIPTGIDIHRFAAGDGQIFRQRQTIASDVPVVGHVGRLAPEKNLAFLCESVGAFLQQNPRARFVVVGYGPSEHTMKEIFVRLQVQDRIHWVGKLKGQQLAEAYHAMDVFAFSSKSETQGLVLAEAMACGVPVVALDAPGVREVVQDGVNGYLLSDENSLSFARAMEKYVNLSSEQKREFAAQARQTADAFSLDKCITKLLTVYRRLTEKSYAQRHKDESPWEKMIAHIKTEWDLLSNLTDAIEDAI
ncbi:MAG TPA: glycosyltransferase family 4 protein [Phycisphaerales bacterium]|nr:glycosyltransferase family 4 protein [Phycisphaerales bacterium]